MNIVLYDKYVTLLLWVSHSFQKVLSLSVITNIY